MPDRSPLLIAAQTVAKRLGDAWHTDAWPALSYLYAGAVLQMAKPNPRDKLPVESLNNENLFTEVSKNLESHDIIKSAAEEIIAANDPQTLSNMARHIVQCLGYPVFSKICYEIECNPDIAEEEETHECLQGEMEDINFRLIPSFQGGGNHLTEPLKHRMTEHLPVDGWMSGPTKVLPRFVRVLSRDVAKISKIRYLEYENRKTNRVLASQYNENGVSLAALPLCRELKMDIEDRGKVADGIKFRIIEPELENWPPGWQNYIHHYLDKCQENQVSIAVLPELIGSPKVVHECEQYIIGKKLNFPILLVGGSWHIGNEDKFYNRMSVYSCTGDEGLKKICTHDKFAQFNDNGYIEDNELGNGFTFLITSIGILALGICRDWLFDAQTDPGFGLAQLREMVPTLAVAPSMTNSAEEIKEHASRFFRYGHTAMIFSNACGQVRFISGGACCVGQPESDARSFVAAPASYFKIHSLCGTTPLQGGVNYVMAPCHNHNTGDNAIFASIRLMTCEEMQKQQN